MRAKLIYFFLFLFPLALSAQWERVNGPLPDYNGLAGSVTCIATNDTFIWIGTDGGGIFRTTPGLFASWEPASTGLRSYVIYSVQYAAGRLVATTLQGVYISVDNGNSWTPINNGLPLKQKITSFATDNTVLLAGTENYGMFRSVNNGAQWATANNGLLDNNVLQVTARGGNAWVLTFNAGLFKSEDAGQSWQNVPVPDNCATCTGIEIIDSAIFIADGSLLVSYNNGKNWQRDSSVKNITGLSAYKGLLMAHSAYRVYNSRDTGKNWEFDWEFNHDSIYRINTTLSTPGEVRYIGTREHGIHRGSIAAITWKPYNMGLLTANINQLEYHAGYLLAIGHKNLYRSADTGNSWLNMGPVGNVTSFCTLLGTQLLVATDSAGVFSGDMVTGGWQPSNNGLNEKNILKLVATNNTLYALTGSGIYRSPNHGQFWIKYCDNIDTLLFTDILFDNGVLYAGTTGGFFKSVNGGTDFTEVSGNIPRRYVYYIKKINGELWLKVGIDTHVSADGGVVWPRYYYVGGVTFGYSLSVLNDRMFAATTSGYLLKDTAGQQWSYLRSIAGLDANVFAKDNAFLYAGTTGGVWRLPLAYAVTGMDDEQTLANPLVIYPNPANTTLHINTGNYPIFRAEVHSPDGKLLYSCNGCTELDIQYLPSGIYFVQVQSGQGVYTQKIVKE